MDNQERDLEPKKSSIKIKVILLEALVIIILVLIGWQSFSSRSAQKRIISDNLQKLEILEQEKNRCNDLLGQQSGDFNQYEYCQQFLQTFFN